MRTILITLLSLGVGFLSGIILSEIIGIAGVLLFQRAVGIKYLPVYLALAFAAIALVVDLVGWRRPR